MAQRLVIISDMWGVKKGHWITSYLGYLQQYYSIVFYDIQQLAHIDVPIHCAENLEKAFVHGGIDTAVAHLLSKETKESHYLGFCGGGTIAWKAALSGLPAKSLYLVSPALLHLETQKPTCSTKILYGEYHKNRPSLKWSEDLDVAMEMMPNFGRELYSDEKIIRKICLDLLKKVTKTSKKERKAV